MPNTIVVKDIQHLGGLIRAARKLQHLRQDEVGAFSHSFIGEIELGKPTAQIGKVFEALRELGLKVHIELPPGIEPAEIEHAPVSRK
jgi:transcriptional regulator with XRE-family HTH domain